MFPNNSANLYIFGAYDRNLALSLLHPLQVNCRMHTNNGDTARAAALAGHGVIWQPTFLIGDDLRTGKLVRVLREYRLPDIDVLALYPSRRHVSAKVRAAIDFLVNAFSGLPPWDNA